MHVKLISLINLWVLNSKYHNGTPCIVIITYDATVLLEDKSNFVVFEWTHFQCVGEEHVFFN